MSLLYFSRDRDFPKDAYSISTDVLGEVSAVPSGPLSSPALVSLQEYPVLSGIGMTDRFIAGRSRVCLSSGIGLFANTPSACKGIDTRAETCQPGAP